MAHPEPRLDRGAQVAGAPGDAAVARQVGAARHHGLRGGPPPFVEGAGAGPVARARHARRVVAVGPVPERPAGRAGEPRRLPARRAVGRVGERRQAGAGPAVALAAGEAARIGRVAVGTDRQGCGHGGSSERKAAGTPRASDRSVTSSAGRYDLDAW